MSLDNHLSRRHCIYDAGLTQALEHKWLESQRYGEDLGLLAVRDWCRRHWRTFQRFRRIEHLFGEKNYLQFPDADFGKWKKLKSEQDEKDNAGQEDSVFELVLGVFVINMENLQFVNWAAQHHLPKDEAYDIFITLDPNCVRLDYSPIIQRAKERLILA